jgi:hypothetical protein
MQGIKLSECLGIKRDGAKCQYNVKGDSKYCGHHKNQDTSNVRETSEAKDTRLVNIISAGAGLITILEKSIQYLPSLINMACSLEVCREDPKYKPRKTQLTESEFHAVYGYEASGTEEILTGTLIQQLKRALILGDLHEVKVFIDQISHMVHLTDGIEIPADFEKLLSEYCSE